MAIDVDADFELEDIEKGSSGKAPAGWYHVQLEHAEEKEKAVDLRFLVVSPGDQLGKLVYDRLWYRSANGDAKNDAVAKKKMLKYAYALRLFTEREYDEARAQGQPLSIDFPSAVGNQAVVEVQGRKYDAIDKDTGATLKKESLEIGFRIFDVFGKDVPKTVAIDKELADEWGRPDGGAAAGSPGNGNSKASSSGRAAVGAGKSKATNYDEL